MLEPARNDGPRPVRVLGSLCVARRLEDGRVPQAAQGNQVRVLSCLLDLPSCSPTDMSSTTPGSFRERER